MEDHPQARAIVETLNKAGFIAYYAGGWVRDFLLQIPSDDIDIATNAPPEAIQALFKKTVPVGIAFGILLVILDDRPYEVATFRRDFDYKDGRRPSRIEFCTAREDALRRDFTINGMFYDPMTGAIFDYVGGQKDLAAKLLRAIGDPHARIGEDRLRMIRAVRLACRLRFAIDPATEAAIRHHAKELFPAVAIERICQELEKAHTFGNLPHVLLQLHDFGLLAPIFPELSGLSLSDLQQRAAPLSAYPKEAPWIAFLPPLLPSSDTAFEERLKLSKQERAELSFLRRKEPQSLFEWAHYYAHPFSPIAVQIQAAHQPSEKRASFLEEHRKRRELLARSIGRIAARDPVVTSEHLKQAGIQPGPAMGQWLLKAERLSIEEQLFDPALVLAKLKASSDWPAS